MWDIGSGLSAFLGVLAGGAITITGQWQTQRAQVRSERTKRRHQVEDRRVAAHEDALAAAYEFGEAARPVYVQTNRANVSQDSRIAYENAWVELKRKASPARLAGPKPVSDALKAMVDAAAAYAERLDSWLNGGQWDPDQKHHTPGDELRNEFKERRDAYEHVAQEKLSLRD